MKFSTAVLGHTPNIIITTAFADFEPHSSRHLLPLTRHNYSILENSMLIIKTWSIIFVICQNDNNFGQFIFSSPSQMVHPPNSSIRRSILAAMAVVTGRTDSKARCCHGSRLFCRRKTRSLILLRPSLTLRAMGRQRPGLALAPSQARAA